MGVVDDSEEDLNIGKSYAITNRGRYYLENLVTMGEYNAKFRIE